MQYNTKLVITDKQFNVLLCIQVTIFIKKTRHSYDIRLRPGIATPLVVVTSWW